MTLKCSKLDEAECFKSRNCEWMEYDEALLEKIDEELDEFEQNEHSFLMDIARSHSIESKVIWNQVSMMSLFGILSVIAVMMALVQCWNTSAAKDGYIKLQN